MSNETHQERRDALILLNEGLLRGDEARSVRRHVTECQTCKEYWEELVNRQSVLELIDPRELAAGVPEREDEPHPSAESLWQLADSASGPPPREALDIWTHVLSCRRCYLAFARCRELLGMEIAIDKATVARISQTATEKWRKVQLTILLSFAAAQQGRLRIRIGPTTTARKSSRASSLRNYHGLVVSNQEGGPNAAVERNLNERWEHTHCFGDYRFKLILIPQRSEEGEVEVMVKVESLTATSPNQSWRVSLRSFDSIEIVSLPLRTELLLGVLPSGHYTVDFVDDRTNELVGMIELVPEVENV